MSNKVPNKMEQPYSQQAQPQYQYNPQYPYSTQTIIPNSSFAPTAIASKPTLVTTDSNERIEKLEATVRKLESDLLAQSNLYQQLSTEVKTLMTLVKEQHEKNHSFIQNAPVQPSQPLPQPSNNFLPQAPTYTYNSGVQGIIQQPVQQQQMPGSNYGFQPNYGQYTQVQMSHLPQSNIMQQPQLMQQPILQQYQPVGSSMQLQHPGQYIQHNTQVLQNPPQHQQIYQQMQQSMVPQAGIKQEVGDLKQ